MIRSHYGRTSCSFQAETTVKFITKVAMIDWVTVDTDVTVIDLGPVRVRNGTDQKTVPRKSPPIAHGAVYSMLD